MLQQNNSTRPGVLTRAMMPSRPVPTRAAHTNPSPATRLAILACVCALNRSIAVVIGKAYPASALLGTLLRVAAVRCPRWARRRNLRPDIDGIRSLVILFHLFADRFRQLFYLV